MKKRLGALAASILLLGAGCLGATQVTTAPVTGDWLLAFDLPDNWVMVAPYQDGEQIELDKKITPADSQVILQSTDKSIVLGGRLPDQAPEGLVEHDYIYISVTHLDPRRVVSSKATNLGDGFLKLDPCDETEDADCGGVGVPTMKYFLVEGDTKYQFDVRLDGRELSEAEAVIMSAKKVTVPNQ